MKKLQFRIQPDNPKDDPLKVPYPYFIDRNGMVGRQDFWRGNPLKLIGFHDKPVAGDITLPFKDFWKSPQKAVGKFPVFEKTGGDWYTEKSAIASVDRK